MLACRVMMVGEQYGRKVHLHSWEAPKLEKERKSYEKEKKSDVGSFMNVCTLKSFSSPFLSGGTVTKKLFASLPNSSLSLSLSNHKLLSVCRILSLLFLISSLLLAPPNLFGLNIKLTYENIHL